MTTLEVLQKIVDNNYAPQLGTFDYDGIAEDVFEKIEELKSE